MPGQAEASRVELSQTRPELIRAGPSRTEPNQPRDGDPKLNFVPAYGDITLLVFFSILPTQNAYFLDNFPSQTARGLGGQNWWAKPG